MWIRSCGLNLLAYVLQRFSDRQLLVCSVCDLLVLPGLATRGGRHIFREPGTEGANKRRYAASDGIRQESGYLRSFNYVGRSGYFRDNLLFENTVYG